MLVPKISYCTIRTGFLSLVMFMIVSGDSCSPKSITALVSQNSGLRDSVNTFPSLLDYPASFDVTSNLQTSKFDKRWTMPSRVSAFKNVSTITVRERKDSRSFRSDDYLKRQYFSP